MSKKILVAGATGNLGGKIVNALIEKGADVYAIVRSSTDTKKINELKEKGVKVSQIDTNNLKEVTQACIGMDCVVSALAGLRDVIIDTQKVLVDAAIEAKVPRFIPSDYSTDFTNLIEGKNRNLDLRREFHKYLVNKPIAVTTIFNGPFMDLLTGDMPLIVPQITRIVYWANPNEVMDFTTTFDVAKFTANVALDSDTPRYLYIAGDRVSSKDVRDIVSKIMNKEFKMFRVGNIGFLDILIKISKMISPGTDDLYPAWQGMQYMRDMMEGRVKIQSYDNDRYPNMHWTSVKEFLISENIKEKYPSGII